MDEETAAKIQFIKEIKRFGEEELGLNFGASFQQFDPSTPQCHWLYVSYPYKIKSIFNKLPYIPSRSLEELREKERRYKKLYDTYIFSAEASGGGNCPITLSLLNAKPERQISVVLHEGWHSTLGLSSPQIRIPYCFEEPSARIVGTYGGLLFAKQLGNESLITQLKRQHENLLQFYKFVNWAYGLLTKAYSSTPRRDRADVKRKCFEEISSRSSSFVTVDEELNNAFFQRYIDYAKHAEFSENFLASLDFDLETAMTLFRWMPSSEEEALQFLAEQKIKFGQV